MKPHAFVAMPFGSKPGPDSQLIDFNRVYVEYIQPALEAAGLEVFRADEEMRAGDIITDMFQELLIADLVVADLTIDNPNVWYELGVRHALRARGIILVCGGRTPTAFDLYSQRKLRYSIKDGTVDPVTLESDQRHLTEMVKATMESWHGRKESPVYHLMPNLQEPDWKSLRIGDVQEFWQRYDAWEARVILAGKARQIGNMLVLADEAPVAAFRAEAWIKAGVALRKAERFDFALEQLERGLAVEPDNLAGLQEKGICLQRLALAGKSAYWELAREHYGRMLKQYSDDAETWALLGRVNKDAWIAAWRQPDHTPEQMRDEAGDEDALLRAAIDSYASGYRRNPNHYYSGINALTLMHLYRDLIHDPRYDKDMDLIAGAVRFAAECELNESQRFWSQTTLGDLEVLIGTPDTVKAAYKEAIAKNDKDWFALNSSCAQLQLLKDLGFRLETVEAGIATFARALNKLIRPEDSWQPRQVLLFSGHMMDAPGRPAPRFPPDKEDIARQKIVEALDALSACPDDLALTQGASGGDILFLEACRERGMRLQLMLPLKEPEFIQRSLLPSAGGEKWHDRYYILKAGMKDAPRIMPDELGPPPRDVSPFERCNLWLLDTALAYGIDKVSFICLWDGGGGDGPGGTAHMYNEVKNRTGRVTWIDSRKI
ncbi:MAG: tetratricopeptide repeat-containing protein [Nitrosospira sp.]